MKITEFSTQNLNEIKEIVTNNIGKEVRPVRVGGDVNNIGMDAISGTVLR